MINSTSYQTTLCLLVYKEMNSFFSLSYIQEIYAPTTVATCDTLCSAAGAGNCLRSIVSGGLSPAPSFDITITSMHLPCLLLKALVNVYIVPALTPVTQFHCTATMAYIIPDSNWWRQTSPVHFNDTAWSEYGAWRNWLSHTRRPSAAAGPSYLFVSNLPLP